MNASEPLYRRKKGDPAACEIHRAESFKWVNGYSPEEDPDEARALPECLQRYLVSKGSCVEHGQGVCDPFTHAF